MARCPNRRFVSFALLIAALSLAGLKELAAARGRPYLDTSLGYRVLLSDNNTLLRGVSLSFDGGDPYGSLPLNMPSQESLNALAQEYGLNTVHCYLEGNSSENPDPVGVNLEAADTLVSRCAAAGLYLIITIGNNGENGSIHSMQKALDFWNLYGARYANETHVIFEAHNEPVAYTPNHWTTQDWDNQVILYNAIRAVAPDTFILLGSFMSFNGPDAAIAGAEYLASQGVDWSNAGFAYHGYTGLSALEDTIAAFEASPDYPALLCTEFWPGDTENGYNNAFESHFNGWMQFQWLSANDAELPNFRFKIEQAGTVWTPDVATCNWPARGTLDIPADGSAVGIFDRGQGRFYSAPPSSYDVVANLTDYTGTQDDLFILEQAGSRLVRLRASNGLLVSTTGEGDPLTADTFTPNIFTEFEWIRLANGDVVLRAYGGGGHLLTVKDKGRNAGKVLPTGDDGLSPATNLAVIDGSQPSGPPSAPPPPPDPVPGPYYGTPFAVPGLISASDFDIGGEGVSYHDLDPENQGGMYRPYEGVDIELCVEGGPNIGWFEAGEWLEYTIDVASAGNYTLSVRTASAGSGGTFHIEFDGVDKTGPVTTTGTGGWQNWANFPVVVTLDAGVQVMRFVNDTGGFNLKEIDITAGGTPPPQPEIYVNSITMSTTTSKGNRTYATAVVEIRDDSGNVVPGATVSGQWSGLTNDSDTGTTGSDGTVALQSNTVRNANGTFTFTVTSVSAPGFTYNPALNVETSDSITYP